MEEKPLSEIYFLTSALSISVINHERKKNKNKQNNNNIIWFGKLTKLDPSNEKLWNNYFNRKDKKKKN